MLQNIPTEGKVVIGGVLLFIALIIILLINPIVIIGAGQRGVVFNNTSGIQEKVLGEGLHFRTPFIESVKTLSVQVQKDEIQAQAASKDLQTVTTKIVVNWHLDSSRVNKIYQEVGDEKAVVDRILIPNTNEVVKAATAKFTAEELLTKRESLKLAIDEGLTVRLKTYNVVLDDVSIVDIDFSQEFNAAIEAKAAAVQNAQKAENDLRRIEIEAKQTIESAKAQAESIRIQSAALAENQRLVEWEYVKALRVSAEKGVAIVPQYQLGESVPLVNIPGR